MVSITRTHCRAGMFTMIAEKVQTLRVHRHHGGRLAIAGGPVPADHPNFLTFGKIDLVELHSLGGSKVYWRPDGGDYDVEAIGW